MSDITFKAGMQGRIAYGTPADWPHLERPMWGVAAKPDVMIRLKRIFPAAEKHRRGLVYLTDTPEVCRDLLWVRDRYRFEIDPGALARLQEGAEQHQRREEAVLEVLNGTPTLLTGLQEPCCEMRTYQLVAADLALKTGRLLLGDDLGLGKTVTCLLTLRDPDTLPALVVCQTHLQRQWLEELNTVMPWLTGHIVRTMKVYEPRTRREMRGHDPDVLIMSYSKLRGWGDHLAGRVRTVIFDEMQELRHPDTDKYKSAGQVADQASLIMGATGTPVYNYGGEIHNILSILDRDALGSKEEFAREWCGTAYWGPKIKVKDPAALGTHLRDQGLFLRRTKKDVGRELPDIVRVNHTVNSDADVLEDLLAGAVDLAHVVLDGTDRKQAFVAAGDLDMKMRHATGVAKAPYVAEFVKLLIEADDDPETQPKVVLFGWHRDVYSIWLDALAAHNPVMYTGSESPTQKHISKARFIGGKALADINAARGPLDQLEESRVLIISLRSGAGLDGLQHVSKVCVFGELDWSPAVHDQCIGRLNRDGQQEQVVAYFLTSEDGADPVMVDVLHLKRQQQEPLRDPDAPLTEEVDTRDRVKMLAQRILERRARRVRTAA